MYSVMIVEDELHILTYMRKKLSAFAQFSVCGAFDSPEQALAAFDELSPDVAFLDVEMPRMSGLKLAEHMLRIKPDTQIVFLTAHEQYAFDAFRVEAIDYMLKPAMNEDIERVLRRLEKRLPRPQPQRQLPVRCFGVFDVWDKQGKPVKWPTKMTEELFACLWVNKKRYLSKWTLVEMLWPGLPNEKGTSNLHTTVYRMKQVLRELAAEVTVKRGNAEYCLTSPDSSDWDDLHWFAEDLRRVEAEPERAFQLYDEFNLPMFGDRGYSWSLPLEAAAERMAERLGEALLSHYRNTGAADKAGRLLGLIAARRQPAE